MSEVLVKVEGVSKKFCANLQRSLWYGVQDIFADLNPFARNGSSVPATDASGKTEGLRTGEFWAVNNVSFELKRGECLGLIGRNGAGKTTLLKTLNGLIKPDEGRIEMRGRVGALIALGAGFNPILTGRENIYVNGAVLGLTKREIDAKIEGIIDFAEIREFIDSPVQSYSSGMHVRLGFAITTALNSDILLIDEALAVGDVLFRSKCYNRLESIRERTAIIFVSHHRAELTRICQRGLLLVHGRIRKHSQLHDVLREYDTMTQTTRCVQNLDSHGIEVQSIELENSNVLWKQSATVKVKLQLSRHIKRASYRVSIMDSSEQCVAEWKSSNHISNKDLLPGDCLLEIPLEDIKLSAGSYSLNFILGAETEAEYLVLRHGFAVLNVGGGVLGLSRYQL